MKQKTIKPQTETQGMSGARGFISNTASPGAFNLRPFQQMFPLQNSMKKANPFSSAMPKDMVGYLMGKNRVVGSVTG